MVENVWNDNECCCECKNNNISEKDYIWNPATCSCEKGKYWASIIVDSGITRDEIIDVETKTIPINFKWVKEPVKHNISIFLLTFLLITILLLVAVSINCYLLKYRAKWKKLFPFHITNNELRVVMY